MDKTENREYTGLTIDELMEHLQAHKERYSGQARVYISVTEGSITDRITVVHGSNTSLATGEPIEGYTPAVLLIHKEL